MKPLPSERELLVGVAGAVLAHRQDSVLLGEARGSQAFLEEMPHKQLSASQGRGCGRICPPPGPSIRSVSPRPQAVLSATCRKRAVEAELDTCKAKLRAAEAQLLEVLEEKLRLRQEVEAWEVGWKCQPGLGGTGRQAQGLPVNLLSCPQEDMQRLVKQLVESQLQRESSSTLRAPMQPGTARTPWVQFPQRWWGRWW